MDPAPDPLAISASAPFPTIPAASSPRPRGGRPRRHAAPFRSDHLAAGASSSIRRSGLDLSRRPAASAFAQQGGSPSVSSWGASRDANFVFGSGVAGAPEMTRSFSSGSGEASLTELLGEVDKLASDDGSGRRSDADAPDSLHYQTEKLDEGSGAPSQTIQSESAETRSLASQICTNHSVPIVFARSGDSLPIPNSVDGGSLPEDGSNISAHGGNVQQNVFVFGGHTGYRDSTANATQTSISKVDSADKDGVTYNSEQLNASIAKDSTCTKFVLQDAKHAFASTNMNPLHSESREVSPTVKFGSSFGSEEGDVSAKVSFIKVPYDIEAVAAPKLSESGLFNEESYTLQDHNVASRNKGGVKGTIPNRRAVIPKKFSSGHQVSSLESVSRRNDHCSGKVSPEQKLKEASSFAFLDSGINCAQGNSYNSASQITESSHGGTEFTSAANTEHSGQSDFIFSASTFDQSTLHSQRRQNKKKSGGMFNPANSIQSLPSSAIGNSCSEVSASQQCADSAAQWTEYSKMEPNRVTASGGAECTKTENFEQNDNCETWRLRCLHDLLLPPPFAHLVSMDFHKGETTQPKSCKWCQNTLQNHLEVTGLPAHRVPGHQAEFRPKLRGHIGLTDQKLVNQGNQAYAEGQLSKAEECYTHGIDSFSPNEASRKALMLCYSNRAATRMSLGKMREALSDCREATGIDSSFVKAQVRAANCLLALGDVEEAQKAFEMCLKSSYRSSLDHKIVEEASDGLQKAQKISDFIHQSKEYLINKAFDTMPSALQMISDALSTSIYSDDLMAMKAEALLLLQRYEDVIRFCEETLYIAERNSLCLCPDKRSESNNLNSNTCSVKLWRYHLIAKSYFFLGKLEEAHQFLKKYGQIEVTVCRCGKQSQESISSLSMAISELLRLKAAGNEAFQSGKYLEAVEHYTAALLSNSESLRFLAICFCNRAAAYQAMGQILDAIADCSLAIALDADYAKAISRRSSLYELIRDYDQAENDLRRLITLLEKQLQENMSMPSEKTESTRSNLNRANLRFSSLERDARKGASLNVYLILGIEPSSSAVDIKKAYRKAALRHHPDKAGKFLVRSENISDAIWREITNKIRRDADYLFKIIGKAYSMLLDPTMRRE